MCGQTEKEREGQAEMHLQSKEELNTHNIHTVALFALFHLHLPCSVTNSDFFHSNLAFFNNALSIQKLHIFSTFYCNSTNISNL